QRRLGACRHVLAEIAAGRHLAHGNVRYPIAKARGFPALTFPRGEDSESRASYEAALHAALARLFPTRLCFGAPRGVSWRPFGNQGSRGSVFGRWLDPTRNGSVCNRRFFISTFGDRRSSPWLKPGASAAE